MVRVILSLLYRASAPSIPSSPGGSCHTAVAHAQSSCRQIRAKCTCGTPWLRSLQLLSQAAQAAAFSVKRLGHSRFKEVECKALRHLGAPAGLAPYRAHAGTELSQNVLMCWR